MKKGQKEIEAKKLAALEEAIDRVAKYLHIAGRTQLRSQLLDTFEWDTYNGITTD